MTTVEDIRDVFSIFHDGGISAWSGNKDTLTLTIDCEYLAERINKSFLPPSRASRYRQYPESTMNKFDHTCYGGENYFVILQ
jgi:hypothetical protein